MKTARRDPVAHALNHELRRLVIKLLWHHHEPLTAERIHIDYVDDRRITPAQIVYHVRQLERDGIVHVDASATDPPERRPFVLSGPNSGEAVRRMGLTPKALEG